MNANGKTITVPDTTWNGTTVATVTPDSNKETWVLVKCYSPNFDGAFVYGMYVPVVNGQATLGPLDSSLWVDGAPAECTAEHGWYTGRGFGNWKVISDTTFSVTG